MVVFYDEIPDFILSWIPSQHLFFVATAPLAPDGHVNVSPKCMRGTFHADGPTRVWYEDLTGSGAETIAHLRENGRITIMFVALSGPPRILRLFGTGTFHELGTPEYAKYITPDLRTPGSRAVIVVDVHKVGSSCGYSIPRFAYASERDLLHRHALAKEQIDAAYDSERTTISPSSSSETLADPALSHSTSGMRAYWALKNAASIDGLPALSGAFRALPELPASAPALRVPLLDAKMGLQEAYETARARELASEDLPSVGAALSSAPTMMETPRAKERDHNMLIIGFVLGLIAAAVMDQLVVLVRRRASQALFL